MYSFTALPCHQMGEMVIMRELIVEQ